MEKKRIDVLMTERGLARSRTAAREQVALGHVVIQGNVVQKPSLLVSDDTEIVVTKNMPFVGRGGHKLEHALKNFLVDPHDLVCIDIGSSTGGFTDCLLQHGALRVYAVDVGTGQMVQELRNDPRVVVMENTDIRKASFPEKIDLVVIDVSFISLTHIFPVVPNLLKPGGKVIALIKPQFEVGRDHLGKGGIVKDEEAQVAAVLAVRYAAEEAGLVSGGVIDSPILGGSGNKEFVALFTFL